MSNLLEDLKTVLKDNGYALEDVSCCICRVENESAEPPWNRTVKIVKPKCFFEAAAKVEYDPSGGDEENRIWVVDPLAAVIMNDETRFYWEVCNGVEGWRKHSDPKIGRRSPAVDVPADKIVLKWL